MGYFRRVQKIQYPREIPSGSPRICPDFKAKKVRVAPYESEKRVSEKLRQTNNWYLRYSQKLDEMVNQDRLSKYTARNYRQSATQFFSRFEGITEDSINKFLAQADASSRNDTIRMFRNLASLLDLDFVIAAINLPLIPIKFEATQPFSENEYCLIREFIEDQKNRKYPFNFDFLLATGIRLGELDNLAQEQAWKTRLDFVDDYHAFVTVEQKRNRIFHQPKLRRVPILDYRLVQIIRGLCGLPIKHQYPIPSETPEQIERFLTLTQWMGHRADYEIPKTVNPFLRVNQLRYLADMVNAEFEKIFQPHRTRATVISLLVKNGHRHPMVCRYADLTLAGTFSTYEQLVVKQNPRVNESKFAARLDRNCYRPWVGHVSKTSLSCHKRYVSEGITKVWMLD